MSNWFRTPERTALLSRTFGLFLACAALLLIAGFGYFSATPLPPGLLGKSYALVAWSSHLSLMAIVVWTLLVLPVVLLLPKRAIVMPWSVFTAALLLAAVLLDTQVYRQNRFHISPLILQILEPRTHLFGAVYVAVFTGLFAVIAKRMETLKPNRMWRTAPAILIVAGQLCTHAVHIWADATYYTPVTSFSTALPLFWPATARRAMKDWGFLDSAKAREIRNLSAFEATRDASKLIYPLRPLIRRSAAVPFNLLIIELDAWRPDCLNVDLTPNLEAFARRASLFTGHFSGGNSSRAGNFSLFYGLPGTYWEYFGGIHRPPVLMDLVQESYEDIKIFSSATLVRPASMDRSAFAGIANLRLDTPGYAYGWQRDAVITDEWLKFTASRIPSNSFFGFLYYDCPTVESSPGLWRKKTFPQGGRSEKYDKYLRAVNYDDSLVGSVLADLEKRNLLDSTVVVITGDHSQEYGDSKQGFNGHGSAFDRWQMMTPLILWWPGRAPAVYSHRTSHTDLVATLVTDLLGVANEPSDFCSGRSLFSGKSWDWLLGESYHNFAVVTPAQVIISLPGGAYEIRDSLYAPLPLRDLDRKALAEAMKENGRFFGGAR